MTGILDWLESALRWISALLVAVILVCVCYQVVMRYFLNNASLWSDTVASASLVWLTFLSTSACVRSDENLVVRFSWKWFNPVSKRVIMTVCHLLIGTFSVLFCISGVELLAVTRNTVVQGIPFPVSMAQLYSVTVISAVLMGLFSLEAIISVWRKPE